MRTPKASSSTKSILALMLVTLCFPTTQASGYSWEKAFWPDFALLEVGNSIQPTADGGFIIVGNALTKVDANGNELWTNEIAGNSVQQTSDGGYIIVGSTPYTEARGTDILLTKTDSFGNEQWAKTFGGNGYDAGESVQQTADGGYVIGGIIDVAQSPPVTQDLNMGLLKTDADGNEQWTKTFGGDNYDVGKSVKQANDGGYIIVGSLASSASVYLVKTDANGNEQWSKTFGVSGSERNEAYSLEKTSDGGYVIAGSTKQVGEAADVYLIKTDADGNEVWSKIFGSSSDTTGEEGYSVRQATDGGYIIAGKSSINQYDILLIKTDAEGNKAWEKTFSRGPDGGGNSVQQTSDGGYIVVGYELLRTDSDGNELWHKFFGGTDSSGNSVELTTDDGYIIAGSMNGFGLIKTDGSGNKEWERSYYPYFDALSVQQTDDGYIAVGELLLVKTDFDGDEIWSKVYETYGGVGGKSVQQTTDGGYIVAGTAFQGTPEPYTAELLKTDSEGETIWQKSYGDGGADAVLQTTDGGYIVAGMFYSDRVTKLYYDLIKTDANGDMIWSQEFEGYINSLGYTADGGYIACGSTGGDDVLLVKTDSNGNELWRKTFGGTGIDAGESVQQTTDGGYILVGITESIGAGKADVYLIKTDANGNEEWSITFGGSENDYGNSVKQTSDGGFIIAGTTESFSTYGSKIYLIYYSTDEPQATSNSGGGGGGG